MTVTNYVCGVGKRALAMHFVKHKEPIIVSAVKSDGSTLVGQELDFCTERFSMFGGKNSEALVT